MYYAGIVRSSQQLIGDLPKRFAGIGLPHSFLEPNMDAGGEGVDDFSNTETGVVERVVQLHRIGELDKIPACKFNSIDIRVGQLNTFGWLHRKRVVSLWYARYPILLACLCCDVCIMQSESCYVNRFYSRPASKTATKQ